MTDNEIIKALECCLKAQTMEDCIAFGCPAHTKDGCYYACINDSFQDAILFDAFSLINRQKAEIERLQQYNKKWNKLIGLVKENNNADS